MVHRFKVYIFSCLILIVLQTIPGLAEDLWQPFISQEGKFSIRMPTSPTVKKVMHKSIVGTIEENTFQSKFNLESFSIEYSDIPRAALFLSGADMIFDETKDGLINEMKGIQLQFSSITFQENFGKLLIFKYFSQDGATEMIGKAKMYLVNQRLYVIVGSAPRSAVTNSIDQFLDSFQLL